MIGEYMATCQDVNAHKHTRTHTRAQAHHRADLCSGHDPGNKVERVVGSAQARTNHQSVQLAHPLHQILQQTPVRVDFTAVAPQLPIGTWLPSRWGKGARMQVREDDNEKVGRWVSPPPGHVASPCLALV